MEGNLEKLYLEPLSINKSWNQKQIMGYVQYKHLPQSPLRSTPNKGSHTEFGFCSSARTSLYLAWIETWIPCYHIKCKIPN